MAALDFPTATAAGQTFEADTGVIYVYVGTPPNGFWSANAGVSGQAALDARYVQVAGDTMTGNLINNARILIGTTTEGNPYADELTIANSGDSGLTIRSGTANQGNILFSDGTSGADEYRGQIMYDHNTNVFGFITDAIERMRIDSNGRLLLGTATEGYATLADKLTIANAGHCGMTIRSGSSHNGSIYFSDATSGADEYDGYIEYQHTSRSLLIGTAQGTRVTIDSSGNLLAGLTSAVGISGTPADLNSTEIGRGYINLSRDDTQAADHIQFGKNGSVASSIGTSTTNSLTFKTGTTERMRINSSGRLLVGTTETSVHPDRLIEIGNTTRSGTYQAITTSSSGVGGIIFADTITNDTGGYRGLIQYFHADDAMVLKTSSVEAMRIDSSGNVGIGVSNPAAPLHVKSTATTQLIVERDGSGTQIGAIILKDGSGDQNRISSTDSNLVFGYGSSNTEAMRIDGSGNVGIGTASADANLHIKGGYPTVHIERDHATNYARLLLDNTADDGGAIDGIGDGVGGLRFSTSDAGTTTERMRISSSGLVGIGTTSPQSECHINTSGAGSAFYHATNGSTGEGGTDGMGMGVSGTTAYVWNYESSPMLFGTSSTERMRIDSSGNVMIGTTSAAAYSQLTVRATSPQLSLYATPGQVSCLNMGDTDDNDIGQVTYSNSDNSMRFVTNAGERMRITSSGEVTNKTGTASSVVNAGWTLGPQSENGGYFLLRRASSCPMYINRAVNDGDLITFYGQDVAEGSISVSGSTVSLVGGHLTRWSQLPGNAIRVAIYRGTVLSNIDEMCEWGDEDNEQLNRMKISDVEGDRNVSGVFQGWDEDDDVYTDDFYCAMTGDFVIRIGKDVTVERGDLLMSAGDGTAKPQEDDIIRSKTIAKVTSTHISETYNDGSYCVPCVLMAC